VKRDIGEYKEKERDGQKLVNNGKTRYIYTICKDIILSKRWFINQNRRETGYVGEIT
jgi:hypothetical protein